MTPELLTFKRFNDVALAQQLVAILEENDIAFSLEKGAPIFNTTFNVNNELSEEYLVKLRPEDFERANHLINAHERQFIDQVEPEYYLLSFTDEELLDVVAKPDEWNAFDVELAKKLLAERGRPIDESFESKLQTERLSQLKKEENSPLVWLILGYICALLGVFLAFFLAVVGVFIGWYLMAGKKTLPNGEQVYIYNANNRFQGKVMLIFSCSTFGLSLLLILILSLSK